MAVPSRARVRPSTCLGLAFLLSAAAAIIATPQAQQSNPEPPPAMGPQRLTALLEALRTNSPYVPGEVLVKFREGTSPPARLTALAAVPDGAIDAETRPIGDLVRMRFPAERDAEALARLLSVQPEVEYAQPNYLLRLHQEQPGPQTQADDRSRARAGCAAGDPGEPAESCAPGDEDSEVTPEGAPSDRSTGDEHCVPSPDCVGPSQVGIMGAPRVQPSGPSPPLAPPAAPSSKARAAVTYTPRASSQPAVTVTATRPGPLVVEDGLAPEATFVPNDPLFMHQWNFDLLDMRTAWGINRGADSNVVVAVIDTGITTVRQTLVFPNWNGTEIVNVPVLFAVNPDLESTRLTSPRDFVPLTPNVPVVDMNGHGTHISGTIAQGTNNSLGVAGIAFRARVMPLKVCLSFWEVQFAWSALGNPGRHDLLPERGVACPTDAVAEALRYAADRGARVINVSLGGPGEAPALRSALQYAVNAGALVTLAAGNAFESGNAPDYPAAYAPQIEGVVAVGAVDRQSQRAYYSNTGPYITLVAPGGSIRSGGVDGLIYQAMMLPSDLDPDLVTSPRFDRYGVVGVQGTSAAAPHVAGLAALLISQGITRPAALEAVMKRFARDLGASGQDPEYGYGLIRPRETLRGLGLTR